MKGKGEKGNRSAFSSTQTDDGVLSFTTLKPFDHLKSCPLFTSISSRDEDEYVSMDELEGLQSELESILASMNKRTKTLQVEIQNITNSMEKAKDKFGSSPSGTLTPQSTGSMSSSMEQSNLGSHKRSGKGKSTEERPAKRMRTDSGRATYAQPLTSKGKGKHSHAPESSDCPTAKPLKNITPGRFWAMVEPYCTDVTVDDLRFLEDQIKFCEDIGEVMKIPSLGRHYGEKWAEEDAVNELGNGEKRGSDFSSLSAAVDGNLNKNREEIEGVSSLYGPLTQRLIQSLLEANSSNNQDFLISDADAYEAATIPPKHLAKQLHIKNPDEMERRIRRELHNQGIFDSDDSDDEPPRNGKHGNNNNNNDSNVNNFNTKRNNNNNNNNNKEEEEEEKDEVLIELKKKQQELKVLSQQNCQVLRELLKLGRDEMTKQELKKKLAAADAEVEETYKRLQSLKAKKKTPNKKDKEAFFKALQDRKSISKQLHKCSV